MALVMFDYDGVIVDSLEQFTSDFIAACRENGFNELSSQEDALDLFTGNVYESMTERGLGVNRIEKILRAYKTKAMEHLDGLKLFDGMAEALNKISQKNKLYVITSNVSAVPVGVLQKYGINCIEDVLGADREKSKVRKIQQTMRQYPHLLAYYVGDTKGDIIEGQEAGAQTIGVAWGWHGAEKLKECSPDYIVYAPTELTDLLCK